LTAAAAVFSLQDEDALMARYDCVLHLITAADGAEDSYTLENNATRTEGEQKTRSSPWPLF